MFVLLVFAFDNFAFYCLVCLFILYILEYSGKICVQCLQYRLNGQESDVWQLFLRKGRRLE